MKKAQIDKILKLTNAKFIGEEEIKVDGELAKKIGVKDTVVKSHPYSFDLSCNLVMTKELMQAYSCSNFLDLMKEIYISGIQNHIDKLDKEVNKLRVV